MTKDTSVKSNKAPKIDPKDSKSKNILTGLAIGAAAGVALGVLLAPKAGKDTIADIKTNTSAAAEKAKIKIQEISDKIKEQKEAAINCEADVEEASFEQPAETAENTIEECTAPEEDVEVNQEEIK